METLLNTIRPTSVFSQWLDLHEARVHNGSCTSSRHIVTTTPRHRQDVAAASPQHRRYIVVVAVTSIRCCNDISWAMRQHHVVVHSIASNSIGVMSVASINTMSWQRITATWGNSYFLQGLQYTKNRTYYLYCFGKMIC